MLARFYLHLDAEDGQTSLEGFGEIPFVPHGGELVSFCDCCGPGLPIDTSTPPSWDVRRQRWECVLFTRWHGSLDEGVTHYTQCGFTEIVECRDMHDPRPASSGQ
jgi:hypothetical protein